MVKDTPYQIKMFITNSQMPTSHRCRPNRCLVIHKISIEISMLIININSHSILMQPQLPRLHSLDIKQWPMTVHTGSQVSLTSLWTYKILNGLFLNIYHQILKQTKKEWNGSGTIELSKTLKQKLNRLSNVPNKKNNLFLSILRK